MNGTLSLGASAVANIDGEYDATGGNTTFTDAGTLKLGGTVTSLGTFYKATNSTVEYDGASQSVAELDGSPASNSYYNLTINGSGTKTLDGSSKIYGDLALTASDFDTDGDDITNDIDADIDDDGIPNQEDTDIDGDGIPNFGIDGIEGNNDDDPYPDGVDLSCQSNCNTDDDDIDGDNIPNEEDNDIDGDGILNQYDPFPNENFLTATICFTYDDNIFSIEGIIQNDVCSNDNNNENNSIEITLSWDGEEPSEFTFNWFNSNGLQVANTQNLENVPPGTYTLLTTHNDGCEVWEEFVISTPEPIIIAPNEFNGYSVPCPSNSENGECEGTVTFDITGGVPFNDENNDFNPNTNEFELPSIDENSYYKYTVNNADAGISTLPIPLEINSFSDITGIINVTIGGLCPGNNVIDIIGQFDCVMTFEFFMNAADLFVLNNVSKDVSCPNEADGSIEIEFSGGNPPYSFEWVLNNDTYYSSEQDIYDLSGGDYELTVIDNNDCVYSQTIEIFEAPDFDIEIIDSPPICNLAAGYVAFDIEGGHNIGEYQYTIESSNSLIDSELIYNYTVMDSITLTFGEYDFIFIDSKGCESENVFVDLGALSEDCLQIPSLFSPNGDAQNDVWQIGGIEDYPNATINVYNRWGQLVFNSNGNYFGNEWDGTHNGTPLPFAVYYYVIDPINENIKTYHGGVTIKR